MKAVDGVMSGANDARSTDLAAELTGVFRAAIESFSLRQCVAKELPPLPPKQSRVRVVAVGKAAPEMMRGALERWPGRIEKALVVTVDGADTTGFDGSNVDVRFAAHPYPDERSVHSAMEALDLARGLGERDLLLALISGGASALVSLPPEGVHISQKAALLRELLLSGASIRDVNLVRRHFSRIKGGRLMEAAAPARVLTLAVSDVIGGGLHDIGSGPSVADPTTLEQAREVLDRFAPAHRDAELSESVKPNAGVRWRARLVAGPEQFGAHLRDLLMAKGFQCRLLQAEEGDAAATARRRAEQAAALERGEALVIPCEPTLHVAENAGRGGRAGWIALCTLMSLPDDAAVLCGATDGCDGSSGSAGACVGGALKKAVSDTQVSDALAAFNDAEVHEALGTSIAGRSTGLNFADVHIVARR
ncbi:MAG: glycerate kinase [Polyangiaceae bacterium]|nr:glycerate kinase [Polyangiaceae bacterium]